MKTTQTPTPQAPPRRRRGNSAGKFVLALATATLVGGGVYYTTTGLDNDDPQIAQGLTATVSQGPLTVSITESGTVRALDPVVLSSQVEGRITVIELAEEGTFVRKGDVVVRLDSAELEDNIVALEISVENARADLVRTSRSPRTRQPPTSPAPASTSTSPASTSASTGPANTPTSSAKPRTGSP